MKKVGTVFVSILLTFSLAGCLEEDGASDQSGDSTDPRTGRVEIYRSGFLDPIEKVCDSTTLLYIAKTGKGGGISAIPDSPECQPG